MLLRGLLINHETSSMAAQRTPAAVFRRSLTRAFAARTSSARTQSQTSSSSSSLISPGVVVSAAGGQEQGNQGGDGVGIHQAKGRSSCGDIVICT